MSLLSPSSLLIVVTQLVIGELNGEIDNGDIQRKGLDILKSKLSEKEMKFTDFNVRFFCFGAAKSIAIYICCSFFFSFCPVCIGLCSLENSPCSYEYS